MVIFISGGCKNGKSYFAQRKAGELAGGGPLYYIATMIPHDEEDRARISRHISERKGWGFDTIEQGKNITEIMNKKNVDFGGTFLLDSVTAIMENEMYPVTLKERGEIEFIGEDDSAPVRVKEECVAFAEAVRRAGGNLVFVSDGICGDKGEYSESTEKYRRALAGADLAIAALADKVYEVAYGQIEEWK